MDSKSEILLRELEMDAQRRREIPLPSKMSEYLSDRKFVAGLLGMAVLMLLVVASPAFITTKNKTVNLPLAVLFSAAAAAIYIYLPSFMQRKENNTNK